MKKTKLLIFASGKPKSGGSGFENLVHASHNGIFEADIVGVVSNHEHGGVYHRAKALGIKFIHFPGPWTAEEYQRIATESGADFFACSGWLKLVIGLDPKTRFNSRTVFNIHPSLLPSFGGNGFYGHHVHKAVIAAFKRGEITHTGVSMHFVTEDEYDKGPVFFQRHVKINEDDTVESLSERVLKQEHLYQPHITNLVLSKLITWDGVNPNSLAMPSWYKIDHPV